MANTAPSNAENLALSLDDGVIVNKVLSGETSQFEIIMRRYNQRLFRVTASILGNRSEAEDVVQNAWVKAYIHLNQFRGEASFSTWLTKIAVYEALDRRRSRARFVEMDSVLPFTLAKSKKAPPTPEKMAFTHELKELLEEAILDMPANYRTVFIMREIEGMSTTETAASLGILESNVKVRLHRGKSWLQERILGQMKSSTSELFGFGGELCDRMVKRVFKAISIFRR